MSVGTAFHDRTAPLNRKLQWREWAGYVAVLLGIRVYFAWQKAAGARPKAAAKPPVFAS